MEAINQGENNIDDLINDPRISSADPTVKRIQSSLASAGRGRNYGYKIVEQQTPEVNSKTETREVIDNFIT